MKAQANKVSNQRSPKAALTYTGEISHHINIASLGPKKTSAVSIQHISFSFYKLDEYSTMVIELFFTSLFVNMYFSSYILITSHHFVNMQFHKSVQEYYNAGLPAVKMKFTP
jgi:hypothetical protein